jgi:hypothetical protein
MAGTKPQAELCSLCTTLPPEKDICEIVFAVNTANPAMLAATQEGQIALPSIKT